MMIINFQIEDKIGKPKFFYKIFLIINIKFAVILKMFFLKLNNADMLFDKITLI